MIGRIHLWVGLFTGPVVFIVAFTGCIYAFQDEICDLTQPYRFVEPQNKKFLEPSILIRQAQQALPDRHLHSLMYEGKGKAAKAVFWSSSGNYYYYVYINPYTGKVLRVKNELNDFFRFILDGHYYLWLPPVPGQNIVAIATLLFFVQLISGLFLWWPRSTTAGKQRFRIRWDVRWRRRNYDLHCVTGFYILVFALIFTLTGLVWGFKWFRDGLYDLTSGGKDFEEYYNPRSGFPEASFPEMNAIDRVWLKMKKQYPDAGWIEIHPPEDSLSSIAANANPDTFTYWKIDYRYFDQYNLEELPVNHIWNRFDNASTADTLFRMNYDLHTGAVLGLPGKILAFVISLLIASLPISGVLMWFGRRKKIR